ncbi:hypothetical protein CAOG_009802 [Capsaspora owczarzaki ATCC 30864]|uniref:Uncharacterized protein n=1 Tax=Capsaspora owczarzaki (strain ATCC 30864) TaxID=595528 RepID=A0A0D2VSV4_CAPO3|nr:hypothetical protein CAOG_009802 [Capsaspora owczarzaki ATCC 30864]
MRHKTCSISCQSIGCWGTCSAAESAAQEAKRCADWGLLCIDRRNEKLVWKDEQKRIAWSQQLANKRMDRTLRMPFFVTSASDLAVASKGRGRGRGQEGNIGRNLQNKKTEQLETPKIQPE